MPTSLKRRIKRQAFYWVARRVARPLVLAYLDLYTQEHDEEGSGIPLDRSPFSTSVAGQFEVAVNGEHWTEPVYAGFGFTSARRANAGRDSTQPGAAGAPGESPRVRHTLRGVP